MRVDGVVRVKKVMEQIGEQTIIFKATKRGDNIDVVVLINLIDHVINCMNVILAVNVELNITVNNKFLIIRRNRSR